MQCHRHHLRPGKDRRDPGDEDAEHHRGNLQAVNARRSDVVIDQGVGAHA